MIIAIISIGTIITIILKTVLDIIDEAGMKTIMRTVTKIQRKEFVPARNYPSLTPVGPIIIHSFEEYHLYFEIDGEEVRFSVKKKAFDRFKVGDKIEVEYGRGVIYGKYVVTELAT